MIKGLKELLEENVFESSHEEIVEIELNKIDPNPYQPRTTFKDDKIDELAASINEHGVIQPIIVKPVNSRYIIIAGERRYKACNKLGLKTIPAIVRTYEKSKSIEIALIENLQRENLSPIEEAKAFLMMMKELGYNQEDVAKRIGKSRSYVTNTLGILNLPDEVLTMLENGLISFGHARALSKLKDKDRAIELAKQILAEGLNVRDIEVLTRGEQKTNQIEKKSSDRVVYNKIFNNRKIKIVGDKNKITIKVSDGKIQELIEWLLREIK